MPIGLWKRITRALKGTDSPDTDAVTSPEPTDTTKKPAPQRTEAPKPAPQRTETKRDTPAAQPAADRAPGNPQQHASEGGGEQSRTKRPTTTPRSDASASRGPSSRSARGSGKEPRRGDPGKAGSDKPQNGPAKAPAEKPKGAAKPQAEKPDMGGWTVPAPPSHDDDEVSFQELDIHPRILRALVDDLGFKVCTPIQGLSLPFTLDQADLAGQAQTGTGKTAAYLITILQQLLTQDEPRKPHQPYALIVAPTRELAHQVEKDARAIGAYCGVSSLAVFGGVTYDKQKAQIEQGIDVLAATPGRLIDYVRQKIIDLSRVRVLVIDEADRMLDMGFIPDVRRIIARVPAPKRRQTMIFSATLSPDILALAERWMRPDPVTVEVNPGNIVAEGIDEVIYAVSSKHKLALLLSILKEESLKRALIFRNRRRDVDDLHRELQRYGIDSEMLSGDVPQKKRMAIMERFRKGEIKVVVATDVAGRGIHIEGISHVINYDFPFEAEDYVHRIGRTGRAGKRGKAISFAGEDCAFVIPEIETFIERELPVTHPSEDMLELPEAVRSKPKSQSRGPRKQGSGGRSGRSRSGSGRSSRSRGQRGGSRGGRR